MSDRPFDPEDKESMRRYLRAQIASSPLVQAAYRACDIAGFDEEHVMLLIAVHGVSRAAQLEHQLEQALRNQRVAVVVPDSALDPYKEG